jgi:hypothetical protein
MPLFISRNRGRAKLSAFALIMRRQCATAGIANEEFSHTDGIGPSIRGRGAENTRTPRVIALSSTSTVAASDIREGFQKKCPNVSLTLEPLKADYALEAVAEPINLLSGSPTTRYRFTLFSRSGDIIYSTSPHKFSNAINNVCMAINKQEPTSATSLVAVGTIIADRAESRRKPKDLALCSESC